MEGFKPAGRTFDPAGRASELAGRAIGNPIGNFIKNPNRNPIEKYFPTYRAFKSHLTSPHIASDPALFIGFCLKKNENEKTIKKIVNR